MKLRQLSLLSLATDRDNLSYSALQKYLDLSSSRQLEDIVTTAIYAELLDATLDPAREAVHVTRVAPLRDIAPGSVPAMLGALKNWSSRCTSTLADLETHALNIRNQASVRAKEKRAADEKLKRLTTEAGESEKLGSNSREMLARRGLNKRSIPDTGMRQDDELMDLDGNLGPSDFGARGSKRKM